MTLFKLWLTFIVMENYERKIIIPTKSTACNSIHTSMIFVPKSHNYNLLWGWKGYDTAYPCKECSYYKILSIFLPQQSKKICTLVQLGLVSRKKSSQLWEVQNAVLFAGLKRNQDNLPATDPPMHPDVSSCVSFLSPFPLLHCTKQTKLNHCQLYHFWITE